MRSSSILDSLPTVPEPQEILDWLLVRARLLRAHLQNPEHQIAWGLIALAALLRLAHLDLIEFRTDQVQHLLQGLQITQSFRLPPVGIRSSTGIASPPMTGYLLALPTAFGRDPRIASAFVALLNVAAVACVFRLSRRHFGLRVALCATALFAVSPWSVVFSRRIAYEGVLVPMAAVVLYSLFSAIVDRRPWAWTAACAVVGCMLCTTFVAFPVILVLLALIIVYHRRVNWPHLVLGILLAVAVCIPYLQYQSAHQLQDLRSFLQGIPAGATVREPGTRALDLALSIHSGQQLASLVAPSGSSFGLDRAVPSQVTHLANLLFLVSLPATVILSLRAWSRWKDGEDAAKYVIVAVSLWVPLLTISGQPGPLTPRSLTVLYPTGFLAMGLVFGTILDLPRSQALERLWWSPLVQPALWSLVLLVMLWDAYAVLYLYDFVSGHDTSAAYGTPYRFWRSTATMVDREVVEAEADQVWVLGDGDDVTREEQPMLLSYVLQPAVRTVFLDSKRQEGLLLPAARPGLYLITDPAPLAVDQIRQLSGVDRGVLLLPDRRTSVSVTTVPEWSAEQVLALITQRGLWALDSGLRLIGYDWPVIAEPGDTIGFATYWTFSDMPPGEKDIEHGFSLTLQSQAGVPLAEASRFGLSERYWEEGVVLKQWHELLLPSDAPGGQYNLFIQMSRPAGHGVCYYVDDQGRILGDAIPLGPFRVED